MQVQMVEANMARPQTRSAMSAIPDAQTNPLARRHDLDWLRVLVFGLLIFYLGTLPFHAMRSYLYYNFPNIFTVYFYLFIILNYCLYLIISSIVLCLKER